MSNVIRRMKREAGTWKRPYRVVLVRGTQHVLYATDHLCNVKFTKKEARKVAAAYSRVGAKNEIVKVMEDL